MDATTWVEVSREGLRANMRAVADHAGVALCAVVKANAYGHGLTETARVFADAGATMLGVARIEEARALRAAGIDAPVLLMMPVPDIAEALALGCAVTIDDVAAVEGIGAGAHVHLKVDTGNGRLGVTPKDAIAAAEAIVARGATADGIWTHFADAAGPSSARQLALFSSVVTAVRARGFTPLAHASNSAAVLALPGARFDMVRVGTLLYGQNPVGARAPWTLRDTFAWYAHVVSVRTLQQGATVGYGSEWTAPRPTRVATLPIGYADGFTNEPHARSESAREAARTAARTAATLLGRAPITRAVYFGERRAPVVGRVAMQAVTVSLEGLDDVEVGAVARIPARRLMVSSAIDRVYR
ncbi:MAG: alanine racemase [Actinomycetota bacterium]